jgi:hypothetical protein
VAPGGGTLVVNNEEAERVRAIFALYLECRSVEQVLGCRTGARLEKQTLDSGNRDVARGKAVH